MIPCDGRPCGDVEGGSVAIIVRVFMKTSASGGWWGQDAKIE